MAENKEGPVTSDTASQPEPGQGTGFARVSTGWFALLDGGFLALVVLAFSPRAHTSASARVSLPAPSALKALVGATVLIHVAESRHAAGKARRNGLPARPWARQTFIVGFPSLLRMRKVIAEG